jgi:hypothetical protein
MGGYQTLHCAAFKMKAFFGTQFYMANSMGGGKGKKDINAKLTTNLINILKYKTNHLKQNQQTRLQNQQSPMQN